MRADRRFRAAESCAVRSAGPAQICRFWVLADHAIETINRRSTRPRPCDRRRPAAMLGRVGRSSVGVSPLS
jgi:hypothetical protein